MDLPSSLDSNENDYNHKRARLNTILEEHRFRYFRGGRVMPNDQDQDIVYS